MTAIKAESFFRLMWITEKALERKIKKQRRRVLLDEKHENFMAALRKWEMLAAGTKVKIGGSEEKKSKLEHIRHIKTTAKKCTKKCASRAKLFFFLIRLIVFFFCPSRCRRRFRWCYTGRFAGSFLAQHSVASLLRHCFEWLQHCSNSKTLCSE